MKHLLLFLLLLPAFAALAQSGDEDTETEQYCLLRPYYVAFSREVEVIADTGQRLKSRVFRREALKDSAGNNMTFLSEADALNYFGDRGWKLVTAFPVVENGSSYTNYLFKRKRKQESTGQ